MDNKTDFENKIIDEIKELIISDGSLSYSERKSLDKIIARINNGAEFKEAIGPWLRHMEDIKKISNDGALSEEMELLFEKIRQKYEIPPKIEKTYFYAGAGSGKRQNFFSMGVGIFLIIVIYILVSYILKTFNIN
ncbi:hypothetical protein AALM99_04365 [Lactococcus muris]|uniref:Uncharacterized protein n=1 Tax=Lactococcus muris TaxID=2941330 RepID=A0ABV4D7D8_9LACT